MKIRRDRRMDPGSRRSNAGITERWRCYGGREEGRRGGGEEIGGV